ncbi:MAG TPA: hypothetical protein VGX48_26240 [Pyrinomonadaceae bacterium]|jgi:hypothetical protein|nr:hypothetical protein [Pyrinomonadaceae bacterium]
MNPGRTPLKAPLAVSLLLAALALAAAAPARAQEQEVPRRPRGPAAGPVIKLPRGEGAPADEQQQPAAAQKSQPAAPLKWEYCTLTGHAFKSREVGLSTRSVPAAVIHCLPNAPEEVEGGTHELAIANALARLGEDGWELVAVRETFKLSEGNGDSHPVFYLKRPKRQE